MGANRFRDSHGRLTAYAFACGYVEQNDWVTLGREHGVYYVRGFSPTGIHINRGFYRLSDARNGFNAIGREYGAKPCAE